MNINVNIFKIYTVCVSLNIHNKYTQYTHIYIMQTKTLILDGFELIMINCCQLA